MIKIVLQVSKQASTAYGVCEVWKQELSTLIVIISRSASSWFSANYTTDQIPRGGNCLVTGYTHESIENHLVRYVIAGLFTAYAQQTVYISWHRASHASGDYGSQVLVASDAGRPTYGREPD